MQHGDMGRRARETDEALAAGLRDFMRRHEVSQSALASFLGVDKGTISRSLSSRSFSPSLRDRAAKLLNPASGDGNEDHPVQESLRLLSECAMLLDAARTLMARALDLVERKH
ncbi:hypothetical protein KV697_13870 [Sphingomonas sanguinis]|uniref:hypothetical protein n=1 Tax=Sphingomonas sanguinis TaxID=33051 RepID=UPI001C56DA46|nr:hypothetical protein [Sphingomonas sanguinis]QXT34863.1 hypothetical protein KV697_13870 [Sphingomonas sanguinis]